VVAARPRGGEGVGEEGQTEKALDAILVRELAGTGALSLGLLEADGGEVVLTPAARELQARVVGTTDEIRNRLWGDLPEADLAAAGRVMSTALSRANAELRSPASSGPSSSRTQGREARGAHSSA
jgi:hypothetical protein